MKRRTKESIIPDITPLIDVVFLLLIFFMVSTVFKKDELALLLSLPNSKSGVAKEEKNNISIELSKDQIAFNGKVIQLEELSINLKAKNKNTPVNLRVDKKVAYERVVNILDLLKKYKLSNLSLITGK